MVHFLVPVYGACCAVYSADIPAMSYVTTLIPGIQSPRKICYAVIVPHHLVFTNNSTL